MASAATVLSSKGIKRNAHYFEGNRFLIAPASRKCIITTSRWGGTPLTSIRANCVRANPDSPPTLNTSGRAASSWSSARTPEAENPTAIAAQYFLAFSCVNVLWDVGRLILRLPGTLWGLLTGKQSTIKEVEEEVEKAAEYVKSSATTIEKLAKEVEQVADTIEKDADKVETMVEKVEKSRNGVKKEVTEAMGNLKGSVDDLKGSTQELVEKTQELVEKTQELGDNIIDHSTTTTKFSSNINDDFNFLRIMEFIFPCSLARNMGTSIFPKCVLVIGALILSYHIRNAVQNQWILHFILED